MRNSFIVKVPPTRDQGNSNFYASASYMETMRQNALDTYNRMRAHDGQEPLKRMPKGTRYIRDKRAVFVHKDSYAVAYEKAEVIPKNDEPWFGDLVED